MVQLSWMFPGVMQKVLLVSMEFDLSMPHIIMELL